jgi:hypothetical protein
MGNKFCKVNNNFVVSADKSFANCITDSEYEAMKKGHGAVSPPGEPQPGRCMYHDIDALRKSGVSELPQTKQSPVYASNLKDSGMKCVKTRRSDGPDEVTATGPIPSNMFEMKPKASASQQDIDAFESNYGLLIMNVVGEPNNKNMNDIIDKMFDTSVMNTNASTPQVPQVPLKYHLNHCLKHLKQHLNQHLKQVQVLSTFHHQRLSNPQHCKHLPHLHYSCNGLSLFLCMYLCFWWL